MLVSEIGTRVKRIFGDETGTQIDDADIIRWCNDGQLDIIRKTHCLTRTADPTSVQGTNSYPLPADFLFFKEAKYGGRLLSSMSAEQFNVTFPDRELNLTQGVSEYFTVRGTNYLLYPYPDTTGTVISLYYVARATTITNIAETPEIPVQFHEAIVKFCLMRAKELDQDWVAAERFQAQYKDDIAESRSETQWLDAGSYPVVRDVDGGY